MTDNTDNLLQIDRGSLLVEDKLPGMQGFLQTLTGYYANFLETSFHKARLPKRKYATRDRKNNRVGVRAERYPAFRNVLASKLDQKSAASFQIAPGKYRTFLPASLQSGIQSAINQISGESLVSALGGSKAWLRETNSTPDLQLLAERAAGELQTHIERIIIAPILGLLGPLFEKQSVVATAADQLLTYDAEIASLLCDEAQDAIPTAVSELVIGKNPAPWDALIARFCEEARIKQILTDYFSTFGASDVYTELRELLSSKQILENTEIYLNFGEVKAEKTSFPLYFVPVNATIEGPNIRLEFQPHLFANKKAIDYVVGELASLTESTIPCPLSERIFYKEDGETYIELAEQTLHKILIGLQAQGEVDLRAQGLTQAKGPGFKITNDISFSLCDRSDESIVNDYEALMTGIGEGGELMQDFAELINNFLTTNPVSIEAEVDKEWSECSTPDRLVFESPLPLAEEQRKITSAIRNANGRFIAVEGPPGTGKSHTIAAIAFEMILQGKSILVLSDKTEALDVVQNKLNGVIERIRGGETEYVNPILRLGKSDSNYANIVKNTSIQKLKTSLDTFRSSQKEFDKGYNGLRNSLKDSVQESITNAEAIKIDDIKGYHDLEAALLATYPMFEDFSDEDERDFERLTAFYRLVDAHRDFFAAIATEDGDKELLSLGFICELQDAAHDAPKNLISLAAEFPKLNLAEAEKLRRILRDIEDMRMPVVGYLFAGSKLRAASREIEAICGKLMDKPQQHLQTLTGLADVPDILDALLKSRGVSPKRAGLLYTMLANRFYIANDDTRAIPDYMDIPRERLVELELPASVQSLLGSDANLRAMMDDYQRLRDSEVKLSDAFDAVPDFDYLKDKTDFEDLNAQILTNTIDERVVSFVTEKRADARTLQEIIRNKSKFPADKFEVLKEAFPCMIAGLREFAEFIPLKSELFDLVIIDEASQVSIAQALPAILRAKKMIVMGDRRQFGNVKTAQASIALNTAYFSEVRDTFNDGVAKGDISQLERLKKLNITNSVMDFFELVTNFSIQLRKHFRGYSEIIGFSSKYFYDGSLQVLKIRGKPIEQVLEFVENDEPDAFEIHRNANDWEAGIVMSRLEEMLEQESPPSAAVITPFREQQQKIARLVADHERYEEMRDRLKIAIFTFDTCQGEERDVIFYSMVATRSMDRLTYIFPKDLRVSEDELDGKLKFQRLNVGFSRGKEKLVFLLSKPLEEFNGSVRQVLMHYRSAYEAAKKMPSENQVDENSPMEAQVLTWLQATSFVTAQQGELEIVPQFELGEYLKALDPGYSHPAYKVDFLLRLGKEDGSVAQVVIEYDGFEYHFNQRNGVDASNWHHYLNASDVERECVLESYGYKIIRINRFNIGRDPVSELDKRLRKVFEEFDANADQHDIVKAMQAKTVGNIKGLSEGTHKKCSQCKQILPKQEFFDPVLKSKYGRTCASCKTANGHRVVISRKRRRRFY